MSAVAAIRSEGEFAGRLVLVTGAAQGIGAATAQRLAVQGARLVLIDRDGDALAATAAALREAGAEVAATALDLTDAGAVEAAVAAIECERGSIEHLAHVAGILRVGASLDLDFEDWDACMAVNARAVFATTRAVARRMRERGRGSIVAVGSNAAAAPRVGMAAYAASKAAAHQYLRCLALELAPHGIRCNIVSPGSTDTAMQRAFAGDESARREILDGVPARYRLGIPLRRIADPDDIAEAICFLLSDRARHITLHDLRIDGGATLDA
ncbi:2,3-dihydro-2,3-dihydroxybenzoate dehydrogenase [Lysobacter sp. BMK333-48F3]|uniref:2,3-dihydro-2,3-dihydroxybenzoate dehydrogenase n=1 Tax=Lysobacter sp. BMK333-48F3 TaxID=2867962 RepID=UPI002105BF75|nr:2,3-dihydro-2,3-dihydroxybenzoate dehydrogenase [Lysobacter sp. BMK333-48F3]